MEDKITEEVTQKEPAQSEATYSETTGSKETSAANNSSTDEVPMLKLPEGITGMVAGRKCQDRFLIGSGQSPYKGYR